MSFRGVSSMRLAIAVGLGVAIVAPDALAGTGQVPSGEQTHPHVTPQVGRRHRTFHLSFTLVQAPGRTGIESTSYRPAVSAPAHARQSCSPAQPAPVTTGSQGEVKTIALRPPSRGWCKGQYHVTVYLQRTPMCGPPLTAQPRYVCPQSTTASEPEAIAEIDTGETHFTIR